MKHNEHSSGADRLPSEAVQQLTQEYLSSLNARGFSSKSIATYGDALKCFHTFLSDRQCQRIQDVAASDLDAYRSALVGRDLAPASLELYLRVVRQFFAFLEAQLLIFLNPAGGLVIPRPPRKLLPVPSEAEMTRLLDQPDLALPTGLRDRALLEMAYATGARRGELCALKVSDLDLANGVVRVLGKGNKERLLPLGKQAICWLERYLNEARPVLLRGGGSEEPALWLDSRGKKLPYFAFERLVKEYAAAAGVATPITPHTFRRACATHMLRNGAHPVQLQMLLGHASLRTLSQYLQLTITELKQTHAQSKPGQ